MLYNFRLRLLLFGRQKTIQSNISQDVFTFYNGEKSDLKNFCINKKYFCTIKLIVHDLNKNNKLLLNYIFIKFQQSPN